jgi:hypothetical protein
MRLTRLTILRRRLAGAAGGLLTKGTKMIESVAHVPTAHASKYLQQLCKHWGHNLAVEFTAERGTVTFPADMKGTIFPSEGTLEMIAHPETLEVRVEGANEEHVERLRTVAAKHLDRFAFREAPLPFEWA